MASLKYIEFWEQKGDIIDNVFKAAQAAEENRQKEYDAAVTIQAVIRGVKLRAYIKYLHLCATRIQMAWRGYLGRIDYHQKLALKVQERQLAYYNTMATKIKAAWRGYYVRKYVHDYYALKAYLNALMIKNQNVRNKLAEYEKELKESEMIEDELQALEKYKQEARGCHYMISTEHQQSVFNSSFEGALFEETIKQVFPKNLAYQKNAWHTLAEPGKRPGSLPPVRDRSRPQGPFRSKEIVYTQRFKPLKPSLRVETDFESVEKHEELERQKTWCKQVIEPKFQPFSHVKHSYERTLHNMSPYKNPSNYGNKTFREEDKGKNILPQEFKTVFTEIPEFEKYMETYS